MLKAKPNLESRIRTLKRDWSIVYDMLSGKNNSGFGWEEHRQLVFTEDAVWNSYINSHKEAGQFKHRSFPYYDQLTAIYAKGRATGKDAQTAADIIEEIDVEDVATTNTHEERNDFYGCKADVSLDDMDLSATQSQPARNQDQEKKKSNLDWGNQKLSNCRLDQFVFVRDFGILLRVRESSRKSVTLSISISVF
ncbi:uncharacterized protein At2g29880 [Gossypium hirsutum]|uniref:Uncharacterized protein At2g29880 n=1 Tax=Gossypium hirsutum TaxID=3635 RepID=A0A1U8NBI1_GOSHI|nr:uncharacterized protein At2g29880 [Gossypium hirsutum]XP_016735179.1 uncharacterized protein At2g29880 [Gossypium hirsutum]XP_040962593.1 uncharacterized protein At2g29880 [Gossypium hirsutum]XP_040962594.1 uncharacterized protein At2g29880 [Gossypium hirsutum]